jgi:hypothetical protein
MNEVRTGRSGSGGRDVRGNLATMIGKMHDDVGQDILLLAGEGIAFGVLVSSRIGVLVFL